MTCNPVVGEQAWEDRAPAAGGIKTDQRDAERLERLPMIDAMHPVRVPTLEEEALRDLAPAGEDLRGDLMRARRRLSKLRLRHDVRYEDTTDGSGQRHRAWAPDHRSRQTRRTVDDQRLYRCDRSAPDPPRHGRADDRSTDPLLALSTTFAAALAA